MKGFGSFVTAALFATFHLVSASKVLDLHPGNFDKVVLESGKPSLVEFFAPWCGHCKKLAPVYDELAEFFAAHSDKVTIAKVDADNHKSLGKRFGVTGFPTIKWFDGKSDKPVDYSSGRDIDSLTQFVAEKAGIKIKAKKDVPSNVVTLSDANFDSVALNTEKNVLVKFYAPWCGHCKALAPTWEKVATDYVRDEEVVIAKLNAEDLGSKATAEKYGITGYPTLKFFPKGSNEPVICDAGRSEADILAWVNKRAGTHRVPGGGLDATAGRIAVLDDIIQKFQEDTSSLNTLTEEVTKAAADLTDKYASYYVKVLKKLAKSTDYVANETKRLERIIAKGNLAPEKADDITIRQNILKQFLGETSDVKDEL
ncbi:protein disulfide-isomerase A4 precursor [Kalaharituber pfeilii]|nr:protein disulfide-isomerase A4 precursor [Kalaharituber pfeilii]